MQCDVLEPGLLWTRKGRGEEATEGRWKGRTRTLGRLLEASGGPEASLGGPGASPWGPRYVEPCKNVGAVGAGVRTIVENVGTVGTVRKGEKTPPFLSPHGPHGPHGLPEVPRRPPRSPRFRKDSPRRVCTW